MRLVTLTLAVIFLASPTFAEEAAAPELLDLSRCAQPVAPAIPDGATASEAELGAAGRAVRELQTATDTYLTCLTMIEKSHAGQLTDAQADQIVDTYNKAVDQLTAVAEDYNAQVRAYKAR